MMRSMLLRLFWIRESFPSESEPGWPLMVPSPTIVSTMSGVYEASALASEPRMLA